MQLMNIEWKWNIPNLLSLLRILLVPVFVILYLLSSDERMDLMYWSFGVLILSGVTDSLDGIIARKCNQITDLGKLLDPVADKLLTLSAFIMLIQHGLMLAWVTVVILARELCVDGLRMIAVTKGKVIAAGKLGKIKTISQIVLILWLMIARQPVMRDWVGGILCLWVLMITLLSGVGYFVKNGSVLFDKEAK